MRYVNGAFSHEFISNSDVSKLRHSNDHVGYGNQKTINVKAVCTCEGHETELQSWTNWMKN